MSITHTNETVDFDKGLPEGFLHNRFFPAGLNPVTVLEHELIIQAVRGDLHPDGIPPQRVNEVIAEVDELCMSAVLCGDTPEHAVNAGLKAAHILFGELQELGAHSG